MVTGPLQVGVNLYQTSRVPPQVLEASVIAQQLLSKSRISPTLKVRALKQASFDGGRPTSWMRTLSMPLVSVVGALAPKVRQNPSVIGGEPEKLGRVGPDPEILTKSEGPRLRMHREVQELAVGTLREVAM